MAPANRNSVNTGEILAGAYLIYIVNSVQKIDTGALLIPNSYIFGEMILYINFIHITSMRMKMYLVLVQQLFLNLICCIYWKTYEISLLGWLPTDLVLLNEIHKSWCTVNFNSATKCSFRKKYLSEKCQGDLKAKKRKYHDNT